MDSEVVLMIKVNLIAVGKVKESYFSQGVSEYEKRLKRYCEFKIVEIKEEPLKGESPAEIERALSAEGDNILKAAGNEFFVFAIEGRQLTSEEFADLISDGIKRGKELNFVIGSSHGLSDRVKNAAAGKISFSKMTLPHTLFRLVCSEQIYRAFSIIGGAAYHK